MLVCTTPSTLAILLRIALSPSVEVLAVELGHDLLLRQNDNIGELAIVEAQRLEGVDGRDGARGVQQLDKQVDIDHDVLPLVRAGFLSRPASPPLSLNWDGGIREETAPTSIFSERPIAAGAAVGIATLIPHLFLAPALSLVLAAIVMGMVAGVYFGFAVVRGNNFQQQVEFNVTLLFMIAALLAWG